MEFIKFNKRDAFSKELALEVNEYLKANNKNKFGSWKIFLKVPLMFSIYLVPYFLMIFGVIENHWMMLLAAAIMGFGMSGIGLAIMHDANHGSFSRYDWVNKVMSYSMEVLGGNSLNWKIQHNVLHHSFTNVHDLDEDIKPAPLLRFSPNEPFKKIHRFQMYYAWFFYSLMTLSWMTNKDFMQLIRYKKKDLLKSQNITYRKAMTQLIINKTLYYIGIAVIPMLVLDINFFQWLLGFYVMHFVSGSMLAFIFQPAHVIEETTFIKPDTYKEENPEESWAVHQMKTTANFENWNPIFTWYVGGLNYQIEHHLFPDISHIHYPKISKIVRKVAKKHDVPYHYHKMWFGAIASHLKMLNKLGKPTV